MAGEEEDDGDDGDKKTKPQNELFQVGLTDFRIWLSKAYNRQTQLCAAYYSL